MKKASRIGVTLVTLLALTSLAAEAANNSPGNARRVRPSCIGCGWMGNCRSCEANGSFQSCRTPDCASCSESGSCGLLDVASSGGTVGVESANNRVQTFRISSATIREVAAKHPRFGATLANFNMFGFSAGIHRVHWTPVPITAGDMDAFIDRGAHSGFFKKYNQRACKINRQIQLGEVAEILYVVTISQTDSHTWTVKLNVAGASAPIVTTSDPQYSSLELTAVFDRIDIENAKPSKETWNIN